MPFINLLMMLTLSLIRTIKTGKIILTMTDTQFIFRLTRPMIIAIKLFELPAIYPGDYHLLELNNDQ
jgi:hypothetical protein